MAAIDRKERLSGTRQVVIKIGTRVVCDADGRLSRDRVAQIADQVNQLLDRGLQVVLVSSGAVGAGMSQLGIDRRPSDLAKLQAVAAIGQTRLIDEYARHFNSDNRHAAQMLLTSEDLEDRTRYLNVRNTLLELIEIGAVPIVNENDTVAVEELMTTFGDNDRLAARVANLLHAALLIVLTDVDGLFDGDPKSAATGVIPTVVAIDHVVQGFVRDQEERLSRGGMGSKLQAARECTLAGKHVVLASGLRPHVLTDILDGGEVGTLFLAEPNPISPRKRWVGFSAKPKGELELDAGACQALSVEGRSLLPIGVLAVRGEFKKGDVVSLVGTDGIEIARGLTNYSAAEVQTILGHQSEQIGQLLGHCPYVEVIHRDNLMLIES